MKRLAIIVLIIAWLAYPAAIWANERTGRNLADLTLKDDDIAAAMV